MPTVTRSASEEKVKEETDFDLPLKWLGIVLNVINLGKVFRWVVVAVVKRSLGRRLKMEIRWCEDVLSC